MTVDSKKIPDTESLEPELEFGNSDLDLEIEKSGAVLTHSEVSADSGGIELSFGSDDTELSFGDSTTAPAEAVTIAIERESSDDGLELSFSSSDDLIPEPVAEVVTREKEEEEEAEISDELQEDLALFNTTRKDYKAPKREVPGDIEFVAIENANKLSDAEQTIVLANAVAAATLNLTEVVREFKTTKQHVEVEEEIEVENELIVEEEEEISAIEEVEEEIEYPSLDEKEDEEYTFDSLSESPEEKIVKTEAPAKIPAAKKTVVQNTHDIEVEERATLTMKPATDLRADVEMQATMRQMREEREDLLKQLKESKNTTRDLEQDNLTLKSAFEESKIEISILRKRHFTELEDLKYRLSMSEDKKILAEEKTKVLNSQKEKLEQKVRIDLSQVRQREKELETKLEMLSIDVDAQVQSRDQKILELRRKIDSLEFNMENVSIREQKTTDDKRKIEDKLNKIMKTLRNSIKNLEEEGDTETLSNRDNLTGKNK